ncbi:FAD-dependent oxidoreductase [Candidatus Roizmanbacteria bacterium]|nr:FAD-dependent oxidoreductase [Candidatus Roizmanbacteria bacterium]
MFYSYRVQSVVKDALDTYVVRVGAAENSLGPFLPGQFCNIVNPGYIRSTEAHPFSIASSPLAKNYLEFCVKVYHDWTRALAALPKDAEIKVEGPLGQPLTGVTSPYMVFLVGGVGISPVISYLRYLHDQQEKKDFLLLYGNRDEPSVVYRAELEKLAKELGGRVVHLLSDLPPDSPWTGYRGFLTKEILKKEVDFEKNPTFYLRGPPVYVEKTTELLYALQVPATKINQESY